MRIALWITAILCAASLGTAVAWVMTAPAPIFSANDPRLAGVGDAGRGKDVFAAGDCASCHATPGQPDRLRLGGGLALASPFGTFRPPNISSDPTDGIGNWDVADLGNALIAGVSPDGKHYYPAFPYASYTGMTVADIKDLYAYLKSLPAVTGRAPPHHPTILFAVRRSIGFWKILFFREGASNANLTGDAVHDRGGYLVETLSHCAECHSTRNMLGAIKSDTRFAGGPEQQGTGYIPNITPAGIGRWSEAEIEEMLTTGNTPTHGRVGSSMADVVINTKSLPESDRKAIARYIKSLAPRLTPHP
ncbi:c-type cytochrome (plasmid) [Rhizobium hidalgonense]|nr:c-type cytochrome [Rhizobium hidalgonense]